MSPAVVTVVFAIAPSAPSTPPFTAIIVTESCTADDPLSTVNTIGSLFFIAALPPSSAKDIDALTNPDPFDTDDDQCVAGIDITLSSEPITVIFAPVMASARLFCWTSTNILSGVAV